MSAEIANPDQLMRIVAVRCEQCGAWNDAPPAWTPPITAETIAKLLHGDAPRHIGPWQVFWGQVSESSCGGRLLCSAEPYEPTS